MKTSKKSVMGLVGCITSWCEDEEVLEIMLNEVKNITDVNKLTEKYKRLFEIVQDDVPYISLYRNKNIIILNQKVGGEISPTNYSLFYKFWTWYKQE